MCRWVEELAAAQTAREHAERLVDAHRLEAESALTRCVQLVGRLDSALRTAATADAHRVEADAQRLVCVAQLVRVQRERDEAVAAQLELDAEIEELAREQARQIVEGAVPVVQGTQRVQASLQRVQQSNAQLRAQLKNVLEEDAASTPVVQPMSHDFDQLDEDNDEHDDKNGDEEHDNDVVSSDGGELKSPAQVLSVRVRCDYGSARVSRAPIQTCVRIRIASGGRVETWQLGGKRRRQTR